MNDRETAPQKPPSASPPPNKSQPSKGGGVKDKLRGASFDEGEKLLSPGGLGHSPWKTPEDAERAEAEHADTFALRPKPSAKELRAACRQIAEGADLWLATSPSKAATETLKNALAQIERDTARPLLDELGEDYTTFGKRLAKARSELKSYQKKLAEVGHTEWEVTEEFVGNANVDEAVRDARRTIESAESRYADFGTAIRELGLPGASPPGTSADSHLSALTRELDALADLRTDASKAMTGSPEQARAVGKRLAAKSSGHRHLIAQLAGRHAVELPAPPPKKGKKASKDDEKSKGRRYEAFVALLEGSDLALVDFVDLLEKLGDTSDEALAKSLVGLVGVAEDVLTTFAGGEPAEVIFALLETKGRDHVEHLERRPKARAKIVHPHVAIVADHMDRLARNAIAFARNLRKARAAEEAPTGPQASEHHLKSALAALNVVRTTPSHTDFLKTHLPDPELATQSCDVLDGLKSAVEAKASLCFVPRTDPTAGLDEDPAVAKKRLANALEAQDKAVNDAMLGLAIRMGIPESAPTGVSALELFHKAYRTIEKPDDPNGLISVAKAGAEASKDALEAVVRRAIDIKKIALKSPDKVGSAVLAETFIGRATPVLDALTKGVAVFEVISIVERLTVVFDDEASRFDRVDAAIDASAGAVSLAGMAAGGMPAGAAAPIAALVLYFKTLNASFARLAERDRQNRASRQREALVLVAGSAESAAEYTGMVAKLLEQRPPSRKLAEQYTAKARVKFAVIMIAMRPEADLLAFGIHSSGWTHQQAYLRTVLTAAGVPTLAASGLAPETLLSAAPRALDAVKLTIDQLVSWLEEHLAESAR